MQFLDTSFLKNNEIELSIRECVEADPKYGNVPVYLFDVLDQDSKKIGSAELRVGHNDSLYYHGNISCHILPQYEGFRLGYKVSKLLLLLAKAHNMGYVSVSCMQNDERCKATCQQLGMKLIDNPELPLDHPNRKNGINTASIFVMDV